MNVLSLFDGMSCGRVALERAGIKIDRYFASEVDKYAIQVSKKNYPDIIHIGDVTKVSIKDRTYFSPENTWTVDERLSNIDILIGGSPYQDLSSAKSNGKGLQGEKSGLFFEYIRLLEECKPKYFLLENVASKRKSASAQRLSRIWNLYIKTDSPKPGIKGSLSHLFSIISERLGRT